MNTYKIFLASSYELKPERVSFENFIGRENKRLLKKNACLELTIWEDLPDEVSLTRKQDDYNEALKSCHIFILLYWTKMGKYTDEEFDAALVQFRSSGIQPKIYVYEKTSRPLIVAGKDKKSLDAFREKLRVEEHFPTQFENYDHLENAFKKRLDELFSDGYLNYGEIAKTLYSDGHGVTSSFIGREEELKTIKAKLTDDSRLMLINAEGGIGKTTLAAKYWEESLYRYKRNAWFFCENGIMPALMKLAPELNVDLTGMNEAQQTEALKRALINVSNDFLLVLDNANDAKDIEAFKQTFRGFQWHVLLTSRCSGILEKEQEYRIAHLSPPLAKALFTNNYKEDTTGFDELLDRLLEAIDYHTLLVEIFSKNMRQLSEFGETLKDFLEQLESTGLFLEERSFKIVTDYTGNVHKEAQNSDAILSILYDFSKLAETERYWLVNMALLPAVNHQLTFLIDLFEPGNKFDFRSMLKTLSEKGWLINEENSYRISPVIQKLVLYKHEKKLEEDAGILITNLNNRLVNDGLQLLNTGYMVAATFAHLIEDITKHLQKQSSFELGLLNYNAYVYYSSVGNIVQAKEAAIEQIRIFKELYEASPQNLSYKNGLAISYEKLGNIYEETGDWQNALKNYKERNRISKEVYNASQQNLSYKNGLAISHTKVGDIYKQIGDWKNALKNYKERNRIAKEIYDSDPENYFYKNGLAISHEKLGDIYHQTGDWKKALKNYSKDFQLTKEIHDASPQNVTYKNGLAISYENLGSIYEQTGDWKNALKNYEERNKIAKEIYAANPENLSYKNGLAISYEKLGSIYEQTGDWKKALKSYKEDCIISKEIYHANPENLSYKNGLAISHTKVGGIYEQTGEWQNALENYQEGTRVSKEIHEASAGNIFYKNNLLILYAKLGGIYERTGDLQNALKHYNNAFEITKEIYDASSENLPDKNGLAISYIKLGGIYEQTGDLQNALKHYNKGFEISEELYNAMPQNLAYKNYLAISYSRLGSVYEQTGDLDNALKNYNEDYKITKEMSYASPENIFYKNGLAISSANLGSLYLKMEDKISALNYLNKANELLQQLVKDHSHDPEFKNNLDRVVNEIENIT